MYITLKERHIFSEIISLLFWLTNKFPISQENGWAWRRRFILNGKNRMNYISGQERREALCKWHYFIVLEDEKEPRKESGLLSQLLRDFMCKDSFIVISMPFKQESRIEHMLQE